MSGLSSSIQPFQPEMTGSQVCLGVIREDDFPKIQRWKADVALARAILAHPVNVSADEIKAWYRKNSEDPNQVLMGIYLPDKKLLIGIVRLMFIDKTSQTAEFGVYIGDNDFQGKKLGREATVLMLNHAFKGLQLHKIYLKVGESNLIARRLYESLGFRSEGLLRAHFRTDEGYQNVVFMGLFPDDYTP